MSIGKMTRAFALILAVIGVAFAVSAGTSALADDEVANNTSLPGYPAINFCSAENAGTTVIEPGGDVLFTVTQQGPAYAYSGSDGSHGLTALTISLTDPDGSAGANTAFTFDASTIKVVNSAGTEISGTATVEANGTAKFVVATSELDPDTGNLEYSPSSKIIMTVVAHTPSSPEVLEQWMSGSDNVRLPVSDSTTAAFVYSNVADGSTSYATNQHTNQGVVLVRIPQLSCQVANTVTPDAQNAFKSVHRLVTISNTMAGSVARGLTITDEPASALAALGVTIAANTDNVKVSKNGAPLSGYTVSSAGGGIKVILPDTATLSSQDQITVEYDIVLGNKQAANFSMSSLASAAANGIESRVVVSATNAMDDAVAPRTVTLLVPVVTQTSSVSPDTISTGETSTVKVTFKGSSSPSGTLYDTPVINVDVANASAVETAGASVGNFKVNGASYTPGQVLSVTDPSVDIVFEYTVTAPTKSAALNQSGITVNTTFGADNLTAPIKSTATVAIGVPVVTIAAEVDQPKPSAKDTVTVTVTASQTAAGAKATGAVILIEDATESDADPVAEGGKFQNVKVFKGTSELTAGSDYTALTEGDYLGVWLAESVTIAKDEQIRVVYEDALVEDFSGNGAIEDIDAMISPNLPSVAQQAGINGAPSTDSNIPASQSAQTSFEVQTPELIVSEEVIDPLDAEGEAEVVNFGDEVTFKITALQGAVDAEGNDFELVATIDDIKVGSHDIAPADAGIAFVKSLEVLAGDGDITDMFEISFNDDKTVATITMKDAEAKMPKFPFDIYLVVDTAATKGTYADQVSGADVSVSVAATLSNLEAATETEATFPIADAAVKVTKKTEAKEVRFGEKATYVITANNVFKNSDGELDSGSKVRNLTLADDIDEYSAAFGYAIDASTLKVYLGTATKADLKVTEEASSVKSAKSAKRAALMAFGDEGDEGDEGGVGAEPGSGDEPGSGSEPDPDDPGASEEPGDDPAPAADPDDDKVKPESEYGEDITDSEYVVVEFYKGDEVVEVPASKLSSATGTYDGFKLVYKRGLPTSKTLTIVYDATTDGIEEQAYSQTLSNVVVATSDNAKPSVAARSIEYIGKDIEPDVDYDPAGTVSTAGATAAQASNLSSTGDMTVYIIAGIIGVAVVAGIVVFIIRRRRS